MGKFFSTVPTQMAGSWLTGAPPSMMLNKIAATMLMVGHMISTVQEEIIRVMKKGLSCLGRMIRSARV